MKFHLGNVELFEVDGHDLTPYLADPHPELPDASVTVSGYWGATDDGVTFPPGSARIESYRVDGGTFTLRLDVEPWFYRRMTGRRHPRINRLRSAYRQKTRRRSP